MNRDLSRRVRPVAGAALAKQAIRHDIKLAARLIRELDKRAALYEKESKEETEAREKAEKEAAEVQAVYSSRGDSPMKMTGVLVVPFRG